MSMGFVPIFNFYPLFNIIIDYDPSCSAKSNTPNTPVDEEEVALLLRHHGPAVPAQESTETKLLVAKNKSSILVCCQLK